MTPDNILEREHFYNVCQKMTTAECNYLGYLCCAQHYAVIGGLKVQWLRG